MSVAKELHGLIDDILSDEPQRALAAYRRLADDQLPWLERRAVLLARGDDISWAAIARLLRKSRQAVHQRFSRPFSAKELTPVPRRQFLQEQDALHYSRLGADIARDRFVDEAGDDGSLVPW
ncbi:MAG: hypothetical protein DRJ50_02325 [Actinobacteria bacterium]|nr:MAG: hypothetical protein DRJ50_02325 [Actinomycetota bacterium]